MLPVFNQIKRYPSLLNKTNSLSYTGLSTNTIICKLNYITYPNKCCCCTNQLPRSVTEPKQKKKGLQIWLFCWQLYMQNVTTVVLEVTEVLGSITIVISITKSQLLSESPAKHIYINISKKDPCSVLYMHWGISV